MKVIIQRHREYPNEIILRSLHGDFSKDDLIQSWKDLQNNPLITPKVKGVITDLSHASLAITMSEMEDILDFLKTQSKLTLLKLAIITNSPKNIVFPIWASRLTKSLKIMPFNTTEAAVNWIVC